MLELLLHRAVGVPMFAGTALLAAPLAMLATLVVATLFRSRVRTLMRQFGSPETELTAPTNVVVQTPSSVDASAETRGPARARRAASVYLCAGSTFVIGATATFLTMSRLWPPLTIRGVTTLFGTILVFATPLPLAFLLLRSRSASSMLISVAAWLIVLSGLGWVCDDAGGFVRVWATYAAIPTCFATMMATRRLRAGGPSLLAAGWLLLLGVQVGLVWALDRAVDDVGVRFSRADLARLPFADALRIFIGQSPSTLRDELVNAVINGRGQKLLTLTHPERADGAAARCTLCWIGAVLAISLICALIVRWQAERYRRRRTSEIRLSIEVLFILFTVSFAVLTVMNPSKARWWGCAGMLGSFALFAAICSIGFRRMPAEAPPLPLLLLRTFGHDRRTQSFLDAVSHRWRPLGPLRLIGGEDAAHATLDLHDFYEFLVGRLRRRFDVHRRVIDRASPDPDGLYRIETYYCHQNDWQSAVQTLMHASAAVLFDLRGFSAENRGCVLELEALAREPHLRSILMIDDTTNRAALDDTLRRTGAIPTSIVRAESSVKRTVNAVLTAILRSQERSSGACLQCPR